MPGIAGRPSSPRVRLSTPVIAFERQIVRGAAGIGAVLAEGADRAIDDAGIGRLHRLVADAEARGDAGPEGFDDHVGLAGQPEEIGAALLALEVEHDALLAAAHVAEEHRGALVRRPDVAAGIALARRLDLDHLGAVIGQRGGEIRPRQEPREVDDLDAFELHVRLPRYFSLSAPSGEQAACASRSPSMRMGLAITRKLALHRMRHGRDHAGRARESRCRAPGRER